MSIRTSFRRSLAALIIGGVSIVAIGCGDDVVDPVDQLAKVLFVHAAPDAGNVDVTFDDSAFANNRAFGNVTSYLTANTGPTLIELFPAGGTTAAGTLTYDFQNEKNYTVFAINDTTGAVKGLVFEDDVTPPSAGNVLFRAAHLINDAPMLRMSFKQSAMGPIYDSIAFGQNTELFRQEIPAGSYTVRFMDASTFGPNDSVGAGTTPVLEQTLNLEAGKIYTFAAMGSMASPSMAVIKHN